MEILPGAGAVYTDRDVAVFLGIFCEVLDMTEDVAVAVLRSGIAKIATEADIGDGALQVGPDVDGDVFE